MLKVSDITTDALSIILSKLSFMDRICVYGSSKVFQQAILPLITRLSNWNDFNQCCMKGDILSLLYDELNGCKFLLGKSGYLLCLELAMRIDNLPLVKFLFDSEPVQTQRSSATGSIFVVQLLHLAFAASQLEMVKYMIEEASKSRDTMEYLTIKTCFMLTCKHGNIHLLEQLLDPTLWPFLTPLDEDTLGFGLYRACKEGKLGIIETILESVPAQRLPAFLKKGLKYSLLIAHIGLIMYFVDRGAIISKKGFSSIDIEVYKNRDDLIAVINRIPHFAPTVLNQAASEKDASMLHLLMVEGGVDPTCSWCFSDRERIRALEIACAVGGASPDDLNIQYLLSLGVPSYDSSFAMACLALNISLAKHLMDLGIGIHSFVVETLCMDMRSVNNAGTDNSLQLIKMILEGAPSDVYFDEALDIAVNCGRHGARDLILKEGRLKGTRADELMFRFSMDGPVSAILKVIELGASNFDDCLIKACVGSRLSVVEIMLAHGATRAGEGLLQMCAKSWNDNTTQPDSRADIAALLIRNGANVLDEALKECLGNLDSVKRRHSNVIGDLKDMYELIRVLIINGAGSYTAEFRLMCEVLPAFNMSLIKL